MRIFLGLALCLCAFSTSADTLDPPLPALYAVSGVAVDDTLNIRLAPNGNAEIIGALSANETNMEVTALSREGGWGRINASESSGWVSMRFLSAAPADITVLGLPKGLRCFGTEPFWNITFLDEPNLILNTPEAESGHAIISTSPGAENVDLSRQDFRFQWQSEGDALNAHILPGQCNDGMSDRAYGLHYIDLDGRKGCCQLN